MLFRGRICFPFLSALSSLLSTLLNELHSIDKNFLNQKNDKAVEILLYGSIKFNTNQNIKLLSFSINYTSKSGRFSGSL